MKIHFIFIVLVLLVIPSLTRNEEVQQQQQQQSSSILPSAQIKKNQRQHLRISRNSNLQNSYNKNNAKSNNTSNGILINKTNNSNNNNSNNGKSNEDDQVTVDYNSVISKTEIQGSTPKLDRSTLKSSKSLSTTASVISPISSHSYSDDVNQSSLSSTEKTKDTLILSNAPGISSSNGQSKPKPGSSSEENSAEVPANVQPTTSRPRHIPGATAQERDLQLMALLAARRNALPRKEYRTPHRRLTNSTSANDVTTHTSSVETTSSKSPTNNSRTICERNCTKNFTKRTTASCMRRCASLQRLANATTPSIRTKVDEKDNNEILLTDESSHGFFVVSKDINDTVNHIPDGIKIGLSSTEKSHHKKIGKASKRQPSISTEDADLRQYSTFGQKLSQPIDELIKITKVDNDYPRLLEVSVVPPIRPTEKSRGLVRYNYNPRKNIVVYNRRHSVGSIGSAGVLTHINVTTTSPSPSNTPAIRISQQVGRVSGENVREMKRSSERMQLENKEKLNIETNKNLSLTESSKEMSLTPFALKNSTGSSFQKVVQNVQAMLSNSKPQVQKVEPILQETTRAGEGIDTTTVQTAEIVEKSSVNRLSKNYNNSYVNHSITKIENDTKIVEKSNNSSERFDVIQTTASVDFATAPATAPVSVPIPVESTSKTSTLLTNSYTPAPTYISESVKSIPQTFNLTLKSAEPTLEADKSSTPLLISVPDEETTVQPGTVLITSSEAPKFVSNFPIHQPPKIDHLPEEERNIIVFIPQKPSPTIASRTTTSRPRSTSFRPSRPKNFTTRVPTTSATSRTFTKTTMVSSVRSTIIPPQNETKIIFDLPAQSNPGLVNATTFIFGQPSVKVIASLSNFSTEITDVQIDEATDRMYMATYVLAGLGMFPVIVIILYVARTIFQKTRTKIETDLDGYVTDQQPISPVRKMDKDDIQDDSSILSYGDFERKNLRFKSLLGEGNFGQVWKAEADDLSGHHGTTRIVAVKTVRVGSSQVSLRDEANIMRKLGSHPNVVTLLGACVDSEPHFLIMEYAMRGRLLSLLRAARSATNILPASVPGGRSLAPLSPRTLAGFCLDIARGMEYISEKEIVHRDLAARNVLLDHNGYCKICDFGMSVDLEAHQYKTTQSRKTTSIVDKSADAILRHNNNEIQSRLKFDFGNRFISNWNNDGNCDKKHNNDTISKRPALPIRWMAPEALQYHIFSTETDVWAFGIVLWEIATLGSTPYPNLSGREVIRNVPNGARPELPKDSRAEFYELMQRCWAKNPQHRPSFREIRSEISRSIHKWVDDDNSNSDYMDVSGFSEDLESGMLYFNRRISEFECEI